jgi:peptidoglycan/xylan/chitin deacetylase (PgdA/CDA1 family)
MGDDSRHGLRAWSAVVACLVIGTAAVVSAYATKPGPSGAGTSTAVAASPSERTAPASSPSPSGSDVAPTAIASPTGVAATPSPAPTPTASPGLRPFSSLAGYISHGARTRKWIALTFDADMYPWMYAERGRVSLVDPRIVRLLEQSHTPATIFLNGLFVEAFPTLVRRLGADPGIELGNHSWDHAGWTASCMNTTPIAPPMTERLEVTRAAAIIYRVGGVVPRFFRFPGFCSTGPQVALVRSLGEVSIGSECFFGDTLGWSTSRQVASVERGCRPGSVVVTHLNGPPYHPNVYEALRVLIPWWKAHGWTVVNVGQLLRVAPLSSHG